mgnify:CR=1 FL=1
MLNQFSRTQLLLGTEAMEKLKRARVAVFGIGGVGGYVCEALVRSGVGAFDLVDDDKVCLTNLNRQIIATRKTVGKYKVEVMRDRILADTALRTSAGDVYARRYLIDPKTGTPLPTYEKRRYRGGYGYALPVFVYLE